MLDELTGKFGLPAEISPDKYRYTVFGNSGGLFEGVKSIASFSPSEIVLCVKCGALVIAGENLRIKKYGEKEIVVSGVIRGVELK